MRSPSAHSIFFLWTQTLPYALLWPSRLNMVKLASSPETEVTAFLLRFCYLQIMCKFYGQNQDQEPHAVGLRCNRSRWTSRKDIKKKKVANSEMCNNHLGIKLTGFIMRTQYFYRGMCVWGEWGGEGKCSVLNTSYVRHSWPHSLSYFFLPTTLGNPNPMAKLLFPTRVNFLGNGSTCHLSVGSVSLYVVGIGIFLPYYVWFRLFSGFLILSGVLVHYMKTGKHHSLVGRLLTWYWGTPKTVTVRN